MKKTPVTDSATRTRLRVITENTRAIMAAWANAPASNVADPVVVVADPRGGDTVARALCEGDHGAVALVSARALVGAYGERLARPVTAALRTLRPNALFVLCIAAGGATAGYVGLDRSTGRLVLTA